MSDQCVTLGCFDTKETLEYLQIAGGESMGSSDRRAAEVLGERLGHLPLALAMAAAYMQRCDVSCTAYLEAYDQYQQQLMESEAGALPDYRFGVAGSLSLSLGKIANQNPKARLVLVGLAWLAPDGITKPLLEKLILSHRLVSEPKESSGRSKGDRSSSHKANIDGKDQLSILNRSRSHLVIIAGLILAVVVTARFFVVEDSMKSPSIWLSLLLIFPSIWIVYFLVLHSHHQVHRHLPLPIASHAKDSQDVAVTKPRTEACLYARLCSKLSELDGGDPEGSTRPNVGMSRSCILEADEVWHVIKSFSLLDVRKRTGSMHRLLQKVSAASIIILTSSFPSIPEFFKCYIL